MQAGRAAWPCRRRCRKHSLKPKRQSANTSNKRDEWTKGMRSPCRASHNSTASTAPFLSLFWWLFHGHGDQRTRHGFLASGADLRHRAVPSSRPRPTRTESRALGTPQRPLRASVHHRLLLGDLDLAGVVRRSEARIEYRTCSQTFPLSSTAPVADA